MVISIITAAVAVTLCAVVAIAYMLGWLPARPQVATPLGMASPGQQVAGTAPGVALLPGETLVTPEPQRAPSTPGPTIPNYSRPAPAATPLPRDPAPEPSVRSPAPTATPAAKASTYARAAPQRTFCVNCGTVTSTTTYPDAWEVRVRFEDGDLRTFRYRDPPNLRTGQRVRLEGDRLVRER
jgi:hypothetical protein